MYKPTKKCIHRENAYEENWCDHTPHDNTGVDNIFMIVWSEQSILNTLWIYPREVCIKITACICHCYWIIAIYSYWISDWAVNTIITYQLQSHSDRRHARIRMLCVRALRVRYALISGHSNRLRSHLVMRHTLIRTRFSRIRIRHLCIISGRYARIYAHAIAHSQSMRCHSRRMRCECAHLREIYACPVLHALPLWLRKAKAVNTWPGNTDFPFMDVILSHMIMVYSTESASWFSSYHINSVWLNDYIWRHRLRSTLSKVKYFVLRY